MTNYKLISAEQLQDRFDSGKEVFILDVRGPQDYNSWRIQGKKVNSVNIPNSKLLGEDESFIQLLPKDREIVVVCAKGKSALIAAEALENKGFNTSVLKDGMTAWSQFYHPEVVAFDEKMKLIQVNRFAKGCLSYMIISDGKAMVVDPNQKIEVYMDLAAKYNSRIEHIVDSHLHADHISGGLELAEKVGASYYISSNEVKGTQIKYKSLEEFNVIRFGQVEVEVMALPTPGHTPGSTSFLLNHKYLMSGDTIFVGGLGRPDLGGKAKEWAQDLYDTIFHRLNSLADDILILPAHYANIEEMNDNGIVGALLGDIRNNNEIMRNENREAFTEQVAGAVATEKPPNYEEIIAINRRETRVEPERAVELEIGPNRCAVHHQS